MVKTIFKEMSEKNHLKYEMDYINDDKIHHFTFFVYNINIDKLSLNISSDIKNVFKTGKNLNIKISEYFSNYKEFKGYERFSSFCYYPIKLESQESI